MRFFNKLERRFGRYAIHNLMYYIIIMYVMGFVMMYMDPMFFTRYLSLDAEAILHGQVWRLVTFLLYPPTLSPFWIIFAALMYYSLGRSLEAVWGAFRFNVFFLWEPSASYLPSLLYTLSGDGICTLTPLT
nr:hypothetical protein [Enterocloster bolteae]